MTYKAFTDSLVGAIKNSELSSKFKSGYFNLNVAGNVLPALTLEGITDMNDKVGLHSGVLNFWSKDMSLQFLEDAKTLKKILEGNGILSVTTMAHRPSSEQEVNKMSFVVTFYI